jgi:predicted lipase
MSISELALTAAKMSMCSYYKIDRIKRHAAHLGFDSDKVKLISNSGSECVVLHNDSQVWIVFRGTNDKKDHISNLHFAKTKNKFEIHIGFKSRLDKILPEVLSELAIHSDKKVYFAGHSLGGAMAQIVATMVEDTKSTCFTFGCPRVGTILFSSRASHVTHYRFVNCTDPIPILPPQIFGFLHHGTEVYINSDGNFKPRPSLISRLNDIYTDIVIHKMFMKKHKIKTYIKYITKNKQEIDDALSTLDT